MNSRGAGAGDETDSDYVHRNFRSGSGTFDPRILRFEETRGGSMAPPEGRVASRKDEFNHRHPDDHYETPKPQKFAGRDPIQHYKPDAPPKVIITYEPEVRGSHPRARLPEPSTADLYGRRYYAAGGGIPKTVYCRQVFESQSLEAAPNVQQRSKQRNPNYYPDCSTEREAGRTANEQQAEPRYKYSPGIDAVASQRITRDQLQYKLDQTPGRQSTTSGTQLQSGHHDPTQAPALGFPVGNRSRDALEREVDHDPYLQYYGNSQAPSSTHMSEIQKQQSAIIHRHWTSAQNLSESSSHFRESRARSGAPTSTSTRPNPVMPRFPTNRDEEIGRVTTTLCEFSRTSHSKEDRYVFSTCYDSSIQDANTKGRSNSGTYPFLTTLLEEVRKHVDFEKEVSGSPSSSRINQFEGEYVVGQKINWDSSIWWNSTKELVQWLAIGHKDVLTHRCPQGRTIFEESFHHGKKPQAQKFLWFTHWILELIPAESTMQILLDTTTERCPSCDRKTNLRVLGTSTQTSSSLQNANHRPNLSTPLQDRPSKSHNSEDSALHQLDPDCDVQLVDALKCYFWKGSTGEPSGDRVLNLPEGSKEASRNPADSKSSKPARLRLGCTKEYIDIQRLKQHSDACTEIGCYSGL